MIEILETHPTLLPIAEPKEAIVAGRTSKMSGTEKFVPRGFEPGSSARESSVLTCALMELSSLIQQSNFKMFHQDAAYLVYELSPLLIGAYIYKGVLPCPHASPAPALFYTISVTG